MVLHDVAQRAVLVVVAAAALHADVLGDGDLHVIDVPAVPDGLEDRVAEPEHEEVLDRLLPEVVVDPVDLPLAEDLSQLVVERACAREVRAEGLLDDDAGEPAVALLGKAGASQVRGDQGEELGSGGEVVEPVSAGAQPSRPAVAAGRRGG